MPIGRASQKNTMFYTVIIFVGLFAIATGLAVVYYVKAEGYKTNAENIQKQTNEVATRKELRSMPALIGAKTAGKSRLGTLLGYLDDLVSLITGRIPEETTAEIKVSTAKAKVKDILARRSQTISDSSSLGLAQIIEKMQTELDYAGTAADDWQRKHEQLQNMFNDAAQANFDKEQELLANVKQYRREADQTLQSYNDLKALMQQSKEEQLQSLMTRLDQMDQKLRKEHQELLRTQAELKKAEDKTKYYQNQLAAIKPLPDKEIAAFAADAKIISVDNHAKTVYLSIGRDDHVYRGLTFSVYSKNMPIPRDGKGKAEVEVFDVQQKVSAAKILYSNKRSPIVPGDIVANLIWDSKTVNIFTVCGDFDFDGDRIMDRDGAAKIKQLVEKWGGKLADTISIETDFLVLGTAPELLEKPTLEQMDLDPLAMDKYMASLERLADYKAVQAEAKSFSIPIFNANRFRHFIGYDTTASKSKPF